MVILYFLSNEKGTVRIWQRSLLGFLYSRVSQIHVPPSNWCKSNKWERHQQHLFLLKKTVSQTKAKKEKKRKKPIRCFGSVLCFPRFSYNRQLSFQASLRIALWSGMPLNTPFKRLKLCPEELAGDWACGKGHRERSELATRQNCSVIHNLFFLCKIISEQRFLGH